MSTKLPNGGSSTETCDVSGMLIIPRVLRRRFAALPELVRGVCAGDSERARVVGRHVAEFAELLGTHHETEDSHLWGTLEHRAPVCALHVERMRTQHQLVATMLTQVRALLSEWEREADTGLRDRLAGTLDEVSGALRTHLGDEEQSILPVAAATMTQREWDAFGDLGRKAVPKSRLLIQLGYVLDTIEPSDRSVWMRATLPGPVRGLYAIVGRRQFAADYRRIYQADPG